jgi:hypothetical protein
MCGKEAVINPKIHSGNLFQMIDNENKTMKAHAIFSYTFSMFSHYPACIRVPVKCEMKRETK